MGCWRHKSVLALFLMEFMRWKRLKIILKKIFANKKKSIFGHLERISYISIKEIRNNIRLVPSPGEGGSGI